MKLNHQPDRVPKTKAFDVLQKPEAERQPSEFFDPFQDLPLREVEEMKSYVRLSPEEFFAVFIASEKLEETTWMRWVDPAYAQALDARSDLADQLIQTFRHDYRTDPGVGVFLSDTMNFGIKLLKLFPKQREQITADILTEDKYQAFISDKASFKYVNYAPKVVEAIQIWPQHRTALVQELETGLASRGGLLAAFKSNWENLRENFHSLIRVAASLCLIDPGLRDEIINLVKQRRSEITDELELYQPDSIQTLTILGAESADINQDGNIEVRLKSAPVNLASQPFPSRSHL